MKQIDLQSLPPVGAYLIGPATDGTWWVVHVTAAGPTDDTREGRLVKKAASEAEARAFIATRRNPHYA